MVANQREFITYGWQRSKPGWSPTKENVLLTDGRDQGKDGCQRKRMYHLQMVEIKAKMVVNQRDCVTYGWQRSILGGSSTKENVSLTDGRDQGQDGRQPKRMYHLQMVAIRPGWSPTKENLSLTDGRDQMVANQRECINKDDRDHGQNGCPPKRMYRIQMIEIKARMVTNQRECITYGWQRSRQRWSPIKKNVSLTGGRDHGQNGRQPKRMYHLRMVEILARMVASQRECITYRWQRVLEWATPNMIFSTGGMYYALFIQLLISILFCTKGCSPLPPHPTVLLQLCGHSYGYGGKGVLSGTQ